MILLVGSSGFIGSYLETELLNQGYELKCLNRDKFGQFNLADIQDIHFETIIDATAPSLSILEFLSLLKFNHLIHISTVRTFQSTSGLIYEDSPILECLPNYNLESDFQKLEYPIKKVFLEKSFSQLSKNSLIVKPVMVLGKRDRSDRYLRTRKLIEQGALRVPTQNKVLQFIDVRDLASNIIELMQEKTIGFRNLVGFSSTWSNYWELIAAVNEIPLKFSEDYNSINFPYYYDLDWNYGSKFDTIINYSEIDTIRFAFS